MSDAQKFYNNTQEKVNEFLIEYRSLGVLKEWESNYYTTGKGREQEFFVRSRPYPFDRAGAC